MKNASMFVLPLAAGLSMVLMTGTGDAAHVKDKPSCRQTWKAYKTQWRTDHKSKRMFMRECRAGTLPPLAQGTQTQ